MSGKSGLASGKCQGILFCQVCMNPASDFKDAAGKPVVGILAFISMIHEIYSAHKCENANNCLDFNIY